MSKSFAIGRHASSRSGWRVTRSVRVWTRIQRFFTPLRMSAAASSRLLSGWFQKRSSAMKTASPDRREVVHDGADRALAEGAPVELPHRAEVAAEGAAARRLDEPDGLEEQAVVPLAVALDEIARRHRDGVEARPVRERRRRGPSVRGRSAGAPGPRAAGRPAASASATAGTTSSPSSTQRASISGTCSGPGNAAAAWPPTRMKAYGSARRISPRRLDHAVVLEGVHAGDADHPRTRPAHPARHAAAEAQVDDRRVVAALAQGRGDVFEPERLDAEERPQPEPLVAGIGAHQQDVHWCSANCKLERPHGRNRRPEATFPTPLRPAGRKKWVTHGLSNRIVYGGLHYGARWLPMAALNTINLVGNSLAVTFLTRHEGRDARQLPHRPRRLGDRGRGARARGSSSSTAATRSTSGACAARRSCRASRRSTRTRRVLARAPARRARLPARHRATSATGRWAP